MLFALTKGVGKTSPVPAQTRDTHIQEILCDCVKGFKKK